MNERIRELAKQAGFMVDQSGTIMVCFTSDGNNEAKKFAELLIRECIDIAYREGDNVAYLALHFGVEE